MSERETVILVVLIDTDLLGWHVGCITSKNVAMPLMRSENGNLDEYRGLELDEQVSFLRHRLAGVLQRGCDRLCGIQMKASCFVVIANGRYPDAGEELSQQVANHFVEWMLSPPITFLQAPLGFRPMQKVPLEVVAGEISLSLQESLESGLVEFVGLLEEPDRWELIVRPKRDLIESQLSGTRQQVPIKSVDSGPEDVAPLINWDKAWQQFSGDAVLAKDLADALLTEAPMLIGQLKDGLASGDSQLVQRAAHTFKSAVAIFSATSLVQSGQRIESLSKQGRLDECVPLLAELDVAMNQLTEELNAFLTANQNRD